MQNYSGRLKPRMEFGSENRSPEEGVKKVEECLESAQKNIEIEENDTAVNRAYYTVFHSVDRESERGISPQHHIVESSRSSTIFS